MKVSEFQAQVTSAQSKVSRERAHGGRDRIVCKLRVSEFQGQTRERAMKVASAHRPKEQVASAQMKVAVA
ncbi:hypothetical protein JCGZ_09946 [Jatropha curcas]|uniref:Uncharacterized protein n=1 Tax=Jatropha curcas TaxID=180498 RepID=A0A067KJ56_JATCU|nr:hypothetical protein JCGZ_09946 [Jatropha curcas]